MWPLWLVEMSLQHIQKNSPRLLPKPAKFEKKPPNGYSVIRKTKCGAGGAAGAGGAGSSPIHKQASLAGRLNRSFLSGNLYHFHLSHLPDPVCKLHGIGYSGTEEDDIYMLR